MLYRIGSNLGVSMSTVSKFSKVLFPLAVIFALVGCNTNSVDSAGRPISLSNKTEIQPWDSRFNTFLFLDENRAYEADFTLRDNGDLIQETITATAFKVHIEHVNTAWYSRNTMQDVQSKESLANRLSELDMDFTYTAITNGSQGPTGWQASNEICEFAQFTARLKSRSIYDNDNGQHDTVVFLRDCGDTLTSPSDLYADFDFQDDESLTLLTAKYGT